MTLSPSRVGTYAQRPAAGNAGKIWVPTDGPIAYYDDGTKWNPIIPGAGIQPGEVAPSNVNPFTAVNSTPNATTNVYGGVVQTYTNTGGASSQNIQGLEVVLTSGQSITAWLQANGANVSSAGIYFRDTGSGKLIIWGFDWSSNNENLFAGRYNNLGTYAGSNSINDVVAVGLKQPIGLRVRANGGNYFYEHSFDGQTWMTLGSESATAFVPSGGNRAGIFFNPFSAGANLTCLAFNVA